MKVRAKKERVALDNRFIQFADFLAAMGSKPDPKHTLDRFPTQDGPYTFENVRWADKKTQANNRRNTRMILHEGKLLPATEVARLTGQSPDTVRKRDARVGSQKKPRKARNWPTGRSLLLARKPPTSEELWFDEHRWVHEDEQEVKFWHGLYGNGEGNEEGTWDLVDMVPANGGGHRRETFREFIARMDRLIVYALTTGDVSELPLVVADKIAAYNDSHRQDVLRVSQERLESTHLKLLQGLFGDDALVTDQGQMACDISWMLKSPDDIDFVYVIQQAQTRFKRAGKTMPDKLRQLVVLLSKLPLGRRQI